MQLLCTLPFLAFAAALPSSRRRGTANSGIVSFHVTRTSGPGDLTASVYRPAFGDAYHYYIDVSIGTPPQPLTLLLDTGSSDVWTYGTEACSDCAYPTYDPDDSTTAVALPDLGKFSETYTAKNSTVEGYYVSDTLTIAGCPVQGVYLAVATQASKGDPPGGIMGIGLDKGESIYEETDGAYFHAGFVDSLKDNGLINVRAYSLSLNQPTFSDTTPGSILFGGYDPSRFSGELVAFPIAPAIDGAARLNVLLSSISVVYDGSTAALEPVSPDSLPVSVTLDSGTPYTLIPDSIYQQVADLLQADDNNLIDCGDANLDGGLLYGFTGPYGDVEILVPFSALVIPNSDGTCSLGLLPVGSGLPTLGDTFMRSAYILYDYDSYTISLAQAYYGSTCTDCAVALQ